MLELALVAGLLVGLVGLPAIMTVVPWDLLLGGGVILIAAGMIVGVPAGLYYHLLLYRVLAPRAQLVPLWWLSPMSLHPALTDGERPRVLRWCYLGAAGFVIAMTGCLLLAVGALRSR
jgi:hypothetical protein